MLYKNTDPTKNGTRTIHRTLTRHCFVTDIYLTSLKYTSFHLKYTSYSISGGHQIGIYFSTVEI